jgi:hypothetical protein
MEQQTKKVELCLIAKQNLQKIDKKMSESQNELKVQCKLDQNRGKHRGMIQN